MTDSMSEVVERLAKAIGALKEPGHGSSLHTVLAAWVEEEFPNAYEQAVAENYSHDFLRVIVRAALQELSAMGPVVVPREPTEAMVRAMTALAPTWDDETSRRKWSAAIDAALKE